MATAATLPCVGAEAVSVTPDPLVTAAKFKEQEGYAQIKPEFIDTGYKKELDTQFLPKDVADDMRQLEKDKREAAESDDGPPKKKIKAKGRFKNRPRDKRTDNADKICTAIVQGRVCRFGDNCKFLHDMKQYGEARPADLGDKCYVYETYGYCPYGVTCLYGSSHLSPEFENMKNPEKYEEGVCANSNVLNVVDRALQIQLRKKQYDFKRSNDIVEMVKKINFDTDSTKTPNEADSTKAPNEDDSSKASIETDSTVAPVETDSTQSPVEKVSDKVIDTNGSLNGNGVKAEQPKVSISPPQNGNSHVESTNGNGSAHPASEDMDTGIDMARLRPGEKKTIDFRNKLYLAPLTTVGNLPFRRVCKGQGADITCSEMATCQQLLQGLQSEWALLKRHPCEDIFGIQLCGSFPDTMGRTAQLLNETCSMDFVDINSGCPIDMFFKKGEGCGLMNSTTKYCRIVSSMSQILDVPLTVKMRTGVYENKNTAHVLMPRLRDAGAVLCTLHGRSREQRYTRLADWQYISQCVKAADPMPLFGNGDIMSYEDYEENMAKTGVAGCMIARGAIIKPWLFTEIKERRHWDISSTERLDILRDFTNYGLEHWGSDRQGVSTTRRFLLEWLSFLYRYIPVGILEQLPPKINEKPPRFIGRDDLETLMASPNCADWIRISEMLLGPVEDTFTFLPKHKANAYK